MPAKSAKQRRAACAEYGRRKRGMKPSKGRPFGTAMMGDLRDFCRMKPNTKRHRKRGR